MKGGIIFLQDGRGCPTRLAIVSLSLRDGLKNSVVYAPLAGSFYGF